MRRRDSASIKGNAMPLRKTPSAKRLALLVAAATALLAAPAAEAGPNVPLCLSLENSYNACIRQAQRQNAWGGYGGGWDGGQGWGGDGGWDDDYYRGRRRQQRALSKQAECARWLYAIQQNNCVR
jgi:hypothetical protein